MQNLLVLDIDHMNTPPSRGLEGEVNLLYGANSNNEMKRTNMQNYDPDFSSIKSLKKITHKGRQNSSKVHSLFKQTYREREPSLVLTNWSLLQSIDYYLSMCICAITKVWAGI